MSAAAGLKDPGPDALTTAAGARKNPVRAGGKTCDSYLLRYQELKLMRENMNQPKNHNLRTNEASSAQDETKAEMPQMDEELEEKKPPKRLRFKTSRLCVLF